MDSDWDNPDDGDEQVSNLDLDLEDIDSVALMLFAEEEEDGDVEEEGNTLCDESDTDSLFSEPDPDFDLDYIPTNPDQEGPYNLSQSFVLTCFWGVVRRCHTSLDRLTNLLYSEWR